MYMEGMREVASSYNVPFVDVFTPSQKWYAESDVPMTIDGSQLTDKGYERFGMYLADQIFGKGKGAPEHYRKKIHKAVQEKNWMWHNDYKIPNGVDRKSTRLNSSHVA